MTTPSFFEKHIGRPLDEFLDLGQDQQRSAVHGAIPDLHFFFDQAKSFEDRPAPPLTKALATSLHGALQGASPSGAASLRERIVTDALLRGEADRDQNVYLPKLFTRSLTRAVPDLIFQPVNAGEAARALEWAQNERVPVTLRGAASTAMGGAVPNEGGLAIDVSRLDTIDIESTGRACVVGAGARLRTIHQRLAERGLALEAYPSNLGGTLVGWFATGGIGMNAFGRGRAIDAVLAAEVLLPGGEHVRFHKDGRLDVPDPQSHRRTLSVTEVGSPGTELEFAL